MSSPRPFAAHQFGLLHLLGLVSLCRTDGDPGPEEEDAMDAPQRAATLHLPQELMVNVLCYLTEQIHEVAIPHTSLSQLIDDVSNLAWENARPANVEVKQQGLAASTTSSARATTRRSSGRRSTAAPAPNDGKRTLSASSSSAPASSPGVRNLRNRKSSSLAIPSSSDTASHGGAVSSGPIDGRNHHHHHADSSEFTPSPAQVLAQRLQEAIELDAGKIRDEGHDALLSSLAEFRFLLGDFDVPDSVSFLDKSSPFGLWLRRCVLSISSMSFSEAQGLIQRIVTYAQLRPAAAAAASIQDIPHDFLSVNPHDVDNTLFSKLATFEGYLSAVRRADYSSSFALVQQFFDFTNVPHQSGTTPSKGLRQHALLNVAELHADFGEWSAARRAVHEGMKVARQTGDLVALNAFTSILRRINYEDTSQSHLNGAVHDAHEEGIREDPGGHVPPMDMLWDVRFGMASKVPLPNLTFNVYRSKAMYYSSLTSRSDLTSKERRREKKLAQQQGKEVAPPETQQRKLKWNRLDYVAWTNVFADLWQRMGQGDVAETYRALGLSATRSCNHGLLAESYDIDPTSSNRLVALSAIAAKLADDGLYETALALLLSEGTQAGKLTSVRDVQIWQRAVYDTFSTQAKRSGFQAVLRYLEQTCPEKPLSTGFPTDFSSAFTASTAQSCTNTNVEGPAIRERSGFVAEVEEAMQHAWTLLDLGQAPSAIKHATKALQLSSPAEGQGLFQLHLEATLLMARLQSHLGACERSVRLLDTVWADFMAASHKPNALVAQACRVRAECLLAIIDARQEDGGNVDDRKMSEEVYSLLERSATIYEELGMPDDAMGALEVLANAFHDAARTEDRDRTAKRWRSLHDATHSAKREAEHAMLLQIQDIQRLLTLVGAKAVADLN